MQDVVTIGKTFTAQLAMFVCAERVYGIAIAMGVRRGAKQAFSPLGNWN